VKANTIQNENITGPQSVTIRFHNNTNLLITAGCKNDRVSQIAKKNQLQRIVGLTKLKKHP
jgi:hypothetical protein